MNSSGVWKYPPSTHESKRGSCGHVCISLAHLHLHLLTLRGKRIPPSPPRLAVKTQQELHLLPQTALLFSKAFPATLSLECRRWNASKLPEGMWDYLRMCAEARPYGKQAQPLLRPLTQGARVLVGSSGPVKELNRL